MGHPFKFPSRSIISPFLATAINIILIFIVYTILRIEYLLENWSYFSQNIEDGSILNLMWGGIVFDTPGIFYTNILYIFLMLLPLHWKERSGWYKMCKWIYIVSNGFFIIANVADSIYFSYTMKRTTWSIFSEFGNESFGSIIGIEILRHWYLLIFVSLLIWGLWKAYRTPGIDIKHRSKPLYYLLSILGLAAATITTIGGIRGGYLNHWYLYPLAFIALYSGWRLLRAHRSKIAGWSCLIIGFILIGIAPIGGWRHRDIRPIAMSNANAYTSRPIETALVLNTSFSMIRSIGDIPFKDPHYFDDKSELEKLYSPIHQSNQSLTLGRKKKNIVIIIIESFGREYIGGMNKDILGEDYRGYTPFTDSLLTKSAWWTYSYDNGSKSIDGMPSILASIPKFVRPFISTPQAVNELKGMPRVLSDMGYSSAFFHGARTGSMGFDGFARSIGFEKYYGREDFNKDSRFEGDRDFDGYWAIWDEPFLQYYALTMSDMKQPFITALFTASNHHPFNVPEKYKDRFPKGTMKIHPTAGYTDHALQEFFKTASRQPWYSNTIFVITNDHTNMRAYDEYRSDIGTFYGPIIIFDPSGEIKPGERKAIAQQIDIMPTLLNYVGVSSPYLAFGVDLFNTPEEDLWAVNYINGVYQYVKYGHILQFDGKKSIGLFPIDDHLLNNNVIKENPELAAKMEIELKALIQSYMDRMRENRLTAKN